MREALAIGIPTFAVILAALWNNSRLNEVNARLNSIDSRLLQIEADLRQFYHDLGRHEGEIEMLKRR